MQNNQLLLYVLILAKIIALFCIFAVATFTGTFSDYDQQSSTFEFTTPDMMCLTIPITDDERVEDDESFFVTISLMSTGVQLLETLVTIQDNEGNLFTRNKE